MQVSSDGQYAILKASVNGYDLHSQIYITDLEEEGKIMRKFPLKPIFTGLKNSLTVSRKLKEFTLLYVSI